MSYVLLNKSEESRKSALEMAQQLKRCRIVSIVIFINNILLIIIIIIVMSILFCNVKLHK